jgi:hypothetical protein
MNQDVRLALAPDATYAQLVRERATAHAAPLLGRIALAVAIIGTSVAVAATGRVSIELVTTIGVSWSFALLVQAIAAAAIIVPARARRVTAARAFELWFRAHLPWTLWFLVPAGVFSLTGIHFSETVLFGGALVPVGWTILVLRAFGRQVLGVTRVNAMAAVHQVIVWGLALSYIAFAIGGWDRVLDELGL